MLPRIVTSPNAFRVFRGYRRSDLQDDEFLSELGTVFMPGTPLMLRELGLAAYLPAVLPSTPDVEDFPDEVALIAYASRERYARARNETVLGRMYTHTHRAVFDMSRSAAAFAEPIGDVTEPVTQFWWDGEPRDWQADGGVVFWAGRAASAGETDYAANVLSSIRAARDTLRSASVLEVIGQTSSQWVTLWALIGSDGDPAAAAEMLRSLMDRSTEVACLQAQRAAWVDEPPRIQVARPSAWNLVFARELRQFLV